MFERKTQKTPALNPEQSLAAELQGIMGPENSELALQAAPKLLADQSFERGRAMYLRILATRQEGDDILRRAKEDFSLFAKAHALQVSGKTPVQVADQLQAKRIIPWLRLGQVPKVLSDNDPQQNAAFVKHISVPKGASPEFAYLLGAYAGTRRLGQTAVALRMTTGEEQLVERLTKATLDSCGITLTRQDRRRHGIERFSANCKSRELLEYLHNTSQSNSVVPWSHLQTSAERRGFIRGFLDFSGGSLAAEDHRLIIGRQNNPGLLEEFSIVLKREGILARVSQGQIPSLYIETHHGLARIHDLELVTAKRLLEPLKTALETPPKNITGRPEQYEAVMLMAERLRRRGKVTVEGIQRLLRMDGNSAAELPPHTIGHWALRGHVPASVRRLQEVEALEKKLLSGPRLAQIGAAIKARLGGQMSPRRVTSAIAASLGEFDALAHKSKLPKWIVNEIASGERKPTRAEYRLILDTVGIPLKGELEIWMNPPQLRDVESWAHSDTERRIYLSYQAALLRIAQDAFSKGEDPREAVRQRIRILMKKSASRASEQPE